jgi:hypothetical protein
MAKWKDIAKFASGAATMEIISHSALALNGILPLHFFGWTISRNTNSVVLGGWIVVFVVSVYYAWIHQD